MRDAITEYGKPLAAGLAVGALTILAWAAVSSAGGQFSWYAARAAGMVATPGGHRLPHAHDHPLGWPARPGIFLCAGKDPNRHGRAGDRHHFGARRPEQPLRAPRAPLGWR